MSFFGKLLGLSGASKVIGQEGDDAIAHQRSLEHNVGLMQKAIRRLQEALLEMGKMEMRFVEMVDSVPLFKPEGGGQQKQRVDSFKKIMLGLTEQAKSLSRNTGLSLDDPLKKLAKSFPEVQERVKQFERLANEFERAQQKSERSRGDPSKFEKADKLRVEAEQRWRDVEVAVPSDLRNFSELGIELLEPCIESYVYYLMRYLDSCSLTLQLVGDEQYLNTSDQDFDAETEQLLQEISALSIVGKQAQ
eukprot:m.79606 g.79606  ORF g.79606 m.79606 type:complete len:248 (+) comp14801_c0_seq1:54-797(+)